MKFAIARLKEPSTWRGIFMLLSGFGIAVSPDLWQQISATGMAIVGLIGVISSEKTA